MSALRRLGVALAASALVLTLLATSTPSARAQESTTSVPTAASLPVALSLVKQDPWVPLEGTFTMTLHIDNPDLAAQPNAAILIQVHPSAITRTSFDGVIANGDLGGTLAAPDPIPVSTLTPDAHHNVSLTFGLRGSDVRPSIRISQTGVYPVEVQLVNTSVASRSFVTWLVVVDSKADKPIEQKLKVAFVFAAAADPIRLPDGTDDPKVVAEMQPGGRLDKVATLLSHTGRFQISLAVSPETAEAWKRLGQKQSRVELGFRRLRASANRDTTEVLPSPYVPIDAAALAAAGLGRYLPGEYAKGTRTLNSVFGASNYPPAHSAFIDPAPTSDAAVNGLRQMVIDSIAVRDQALITVPHDFTPDEAFVLDTTGGVSRGVATAPFVEDLFNGPDPTALRAERVVAALAEIAYEQPSIPRGIVIAPPVRWKPDLPTMQAVIAALRTLPLVQSATLDDLFLNTVNEQVLGTDVQRRLVPAVPPATPVDPDEYQAVATELTAYAEMVGVKDPIVTHGRAALLTTLSTSITADRAHTELAKIDTAIHAFTSGVTADEKRITLTSRRAKVPLTFENNLKPARNVRVRVHLDSTKLLFPDGPDQTVTLKPGSNTIGFTVEARASGTFPMTISVTSPSGKLAFGPKVSVSVRSAVFGGWAVAVTVAALLFLAGWWANHFRRTRKGRRLAAASSSPTPTPA